MSANPSPKRFYPQHPIGKPVDPVTQNTQTRFTLDNVYDVQEAINQMTGGGTAFAIIAAGAVSKIIVAFPGFGYQSAPVVTISGGGGAGAKATAKIVNGRITSIVVTAGGAGYTSTPDVTLSQ